MDNDALHHRLIDGDPQRPWLVFLHEGLGCTAMWSDFAERLCALSGCRGLLYDRRGHGRSPATDVPRTLHYLHAAALQELPDVLARLIAGQPYLLIGHSDGGSIALLHAAERAPLLRAAITVAAHVFVEPMTLDGIRRAVEAWQLGKLQGLARYHGERSTALFEAWSQTWLSPWFRHWNIEYLLPAIRCPLLVLQGCDDQYGSAAQVERIVEQVGGRSEAAFIEDCGHVPHREALPQTLALMSRFIAAQT